MKVEVFNRRLIFRISRGWDKRTRSLHWCRKCKSFYFWLPLFLSRKAPYEFLEEKTKESINFSFCFSIAEVQSVSHKFETIMRQTANKVASPWTRF